MLDDLRLAFSSLTLRPVLLTMAFSLSGTLLLFAGLAWAVHALILQSDLIRSGWLESLAGMGGAALTLLLGWLLFPATATALCTPFLEQLAAQIEARQYRDLPVARPASLRDQLVATLRALVRALGLNLLALPFYFIPVINLIVYFIVNARLLAQDYFLTVALRHVSLPQAQALQAAHAWALWGRGSLIAGLFLIPGINLLAPILATALMTHALWHPRTGWLRQMLALEASNVLPNQPIAVKPLGS